MRIFREGPSDLDTYVVRIQLRVACPRSKYGVGAECERTAEHVKRRVKPVGRVGFNCHRSGNRLEPDAVIPQQGDLHARQRLARIIPRRRRLLLRETMERSQSPDQIECVNPPHLAPGKLAGNNFEGQTIVDVVERRNDHTFNNTCARCERVAWTLTLEALMQLRPKRNDPAKKDLMCGECCAKQDAKPIDVKNMSKRLTRRLRNERKAMKKAKRRAR